MEDFGDIFIKSKITCCCVSPDGSTVVSSSRSPKLVWHNLVDGSLQPIRVVEASTEWVCGDRRHGFTATRCNVAPFLLMGNWLHLVLTTDILGYGML